MKFSRLCNLLHQISCSGSRSGLNWSFYSTMAKQNRKTTRPLRGATNELYRRISPVGDHNVSIVPILDQWIKEGRSVDQECLKSIIRQLRFYNRYNHALEVSMWMTDKRHFELSTPDAAIRLELISKAKGVDEAEKYFNNLSRHRKGLTVYCALLKCYATALCSEKAEAVIQKMRDLGHVRNVAVYNTILNLYCKTGNINKFEAVLKEMEENGIDRDQFTLAIQLSAYADVKDIKGMNKIVTLMECDPNQVPDWTTYSTAATAYIKAGLFDQALEMLNKVEAQLTSFPKFSLFNSLITQYANLGKRDEVVRVWSLYKQFKVYNQGYKCVLHSLVKLGDIETAEKVFGEWESKGLSYDMKVPNILIGGYSRKGMFDKAEALIERAISKGGKPNAWTWYSLVEGYLQYDQPQKAVEMMKRAILSSVPEWKADIACLKACMKYLKGVGDVELEEQFVRLLLERNIISSDELEELSTPKTD